MPDVPTPTHRAHRTEQTTLFIDSNAASMVPVLRPQVASYTPAHVAVPGRIRSTGVCMLLTVLTLGIYVLVWYYRTHDEMKRHTGQGLGGGPALLLAFFVGFVMPYLTASQVGDLYARSGRAKPVSGATGLWYFPGLLLVVGPLVWFVKTNGALNAYWRSQGAS